MILCVSFCKLITRERIKYFRELILTDNAHFVSSGNPWFLRGTSYNNGTNSGVFAFDNDHGSVSSNWSFRVVLDTIFDIELSKETFKNRINFLRFI